MSYNILDGQWIICNTREEFKSAQAGYRVQKGFWYGAGKYYKVWWEQTCPRGCCMDSCVELLAPDEVKEQVREKMKELAELLKQCIT